LGKPTQIVLNVDFAQMGVGGDNSWGCICHPQYQLDESRYEFTYRVEPTGF
jgi:beta-galactosidase